MVQLAQYCFRALQDCFQHLENVRALDFVLCSKIFLRAGNNPDVFKNSTEHAEPLLIALIDHSSDVTTMQELVVSQNVGRKHPSDVVRHIRS